MRECNLRPLSARDQIEVLDCDAGTTPSALLVTGVLARCCGLSEEDAARLTVGEREHLLLKLRSLTFGDRMSCVLRCPRVECGERMDLDLRVSELILTSTPRASGIHEAMVDDWLVRFRVPDGKDQEAVARMAFGDEQRAVEVLLSRCVESVERDGRPSEEIPSAVADRISEIMAEMEPQAEIVLDANCPACGKAFRTILDTASFFLTEISAHAQALLAEVHLLAYVYHWSEAAILAMPERRRRRYLDLAEGSLTRRALA